MPLKPHPANPAVKANAPAATNGNRRAEDIVRRFSPPANTTRPVSPPGHQKTTAIKVDPSGLSGVPAGNMLLVSAR